MSIYAKKTNERIIRSTIRIDPDCYVGNKVVKFRASVEKPRIFYLMELIEDDPGEITQTVQQILPPERTIKSFAEVERETILNSLSIFGGDKLATATALGIGKTTLYRKLAEYDATTPKHHLYLEMQHTCNTKRSTDEAQSQGQEPKTSNLNS